MMMILAPSATVTRAGAIANPTLDGAEAMKSSAINSANNSPTTISFERYKKTMRGAFSRSFDQGSYVFRQVDLGISAGSSDGSPWPRRIDHPGLPWQGDPVDEFYVISSGTCEVPRVTVRHVSHPIPRVTVRRVSP